MRISKVLTSSGLSGFYSDDKLAIAKDAKMDGHFYVGAPLSKGYTSIRMPGESVSVILVMDNGEVVYGDCCSSQYSGAVGRKDPFKADKNIQIIKDHVTPCLEGSNIDDFKTSSREIEEIKINGDELHPGILYGVTQALLKAVAKKNKVTMAEIIAEEYGTTVTDEMIPIYIQTGDDRYLGVDKAILKRADLLPHGLINNARAKVGMKGEILLGYVKWVVDRIRKFGEEDYNPILHFDTYGRIGEVFNDDLELVRDYLLKLEDAAKPYRLQIEMPIEAGNKMGEMYTLKRLKTMLKEADSCVKLVVDEWANTFEEIKEWADAKAADIIQIKPTDTGSVDKIIRAILYCKNREVGAYLGGTCNETDRSAQVCVHIALATKPHQMLAKPGMAVDEAMMIVHNEMRRTLALIDSRKNSSRAGM